jgi:beta-glucosidase
VTLAGRAEPVRAARRFVGEVLAPGNPCGDDAASNGTISGSGTTLGTYTVTVTATDTEGVSVTDTFVWSVVQ